MLISLFALLSLVHLPVILAYSNYENYSNEVLDVYQKVLSLGNMGFAGPRCVQVGLGADSALLSCPAGKINRLIDFGFTSINEDQNLCIRPPGTELECKTDMKHAQAHIESLCLGKDSCLVPNLTAMVNGMHCRRIETQFFVQYACAHTEEQLAGRRRDGALTSCVAVFSALAVLTMIF